MAVIARQEKQSNCDRRSIIVKDRAHRAGFFCALAAGDNRNAILECTAVGMLSIITNQLGQVFSQLFLAPRTLAMAQCALNSTTNVLIIACACF